MLDAIKTDVLVVGGGGAGCRAAIEAHDKGADVVMMVKGRLGHSGCTFNVGTSAAVGPWGEPDDTTDSAMRDLLAHGGYLGIQELAKVLVEEAPDRVLELEEWGIDFEREDDGSIAMHWSAAHARTRNLAFKPRGDVQFDYGSLPGFAMMDVLIRQVRSRNIRVLDDVALVDLLVEDGRTVGALALDSPANELLPVYAKSTILATGTYSQVFEPTTVDVFETGDGQAAAYRAGADLIDMESTQFVSTSVSSPSGTVFLNAKGEAFLENYGISDSRKVTKEELCYAIGREIEEGRGTERDTIYLDLTKPLRDDPNSIVAKRIQEYVPRVAGGEDYNVDPFKEPVESEPQSHTTIGGIRINEKCETTVPGLYAAGAVAGGVYGHARPEGYTSMITVVFGRRAGMYAAETAAAAPDTVADGTALAGLAARATSLVDAGSEADAEALKDRIRKSTRRSAWLVKNAERLSKGLRDVDEIRSSFNPTRVGDGFDWQAAMELDNMLLCTEVMLKCSEVRTESRGAFFRSDYPNTDNGNWLKNIVIRKDGAESTIETVPVELTYVGPDPAKPLVSLHVGRGV